MAHWTKGETNKTIADCTEAVRLDPMLDNAYCNRGVAHQYRGEIPEAITDYNEAVHLNPGNATALYNRGSAYYLKREYDKAAADLTQAIRLSPKKAWAYYYRGATFRKKATSIGPSPTSRRPFTLTRGSPTHTASAALPTQRRAIPRRP